MIYPVTATATTITRIVGQHRNVQILFGLSPRGNGNDCYRTYELLLNGVIPVVEAHPEYNELFQDLPVLQLPHWNYMQSELVELMRAFAFSPAFLNKTFEAGWKCLFLKHWRNQVLQDAGRLDEIVQDDQGNKYYTFWHYSRYSKPHIPEHDAAIKRGSRKKHKKRKNSSNGASHFHFPYHRRVLRWGMNRGVRCFR